MIALLILESALVLTELRVSSLVVGNPEVTIARSPDTPFGPARTAILYTIPFAQFPPSKPPNRAHPSCANLPKRYLLDCSSVTVVGIEVTLMKKVSSNLAEILRSAHARVEQSTSLSTDDPALVELRHLVVRLIAELEVEKMRKAA